MSARDERMVATTMMKGYSMRHVIPCCPCRDCVAARAGLPPKPLDGEWMIVVDRENDASYRQMAQVLESVNEAVNDAGIHCAVTYAEAIRMIAERNPKR